MTVIAVTRRKRSYQVPGTVHPLHTLARNSASCGSILRDRFPADGMCTGCTAYPPGTRQLPRRLRIVVDSGIKGSLASPKRKHMSCSGQRAIPLAIHTAICVRSKDRQGLIDSLPVIVEIGV